LRRGSDADSSPRAVASSSLFSTGHLRDSLCWLGRQPVLLFLFVLALNAVRFPYQGRVHDATVYSFQALNHLSGGQFSDDLFFKYGSQDRFSAFSTLVSPLAGLAGLEVTFFVLYLLSIALFYWSALRLIRALTDNHVVVALAAILIAVSPLWFGGLQIFRSNEAFFTPRLPACALSLFALERALKGRLLGAAACLGAALVLHPLMAEGAVLVCLTYAGWGVLEQRTVPVKVAAVAAAVALLVIGISITGRYVPVLDDTWRAIIRQASPYNFPADWDPSDWLTVIGSIATVSAAAYLMRGTPALARLLGATVVVAACGLALTWFASASTHSLLFQVQPYRALWLLALLQIPCGLLLVVVMWTGEFRSRRWLALLVCAYLLRSQIPGVQLQLTVLMLPIAFLVVRLAIPGRRLANDLWMAAAFGTAAGILAIIAMGCIHLLVQRNRLLAEFDPIAYLRMWLTVPASFGWLAGACAAVWLMFRRQPRAAVVVVSLIGCFLLAHAAAVSVPSMHSYKYRFLSKGVRNLDFVKTQLERLKARDTPLTIYMDWGAPGDAWLRLHASSYFELTQVVGVIFSRQTAQEAARRARTVAPFEARRHAEDREFSPQNLRLMTDRLFGLSPPAPSLQALQRLCTDEAVDYAALEESIDPAESISNGTIHIYDCRQFRTR
jgi:hypothetical protein